MGVVGLRMQIYTMLAQPYVAMPPAALCPFHFSVCVLETHTVITYQSEGGSLFYLRQVQSGHLTNHNGLLSHHLSMMHAVSSCLVSFARLFHASLAIPFPHVFNLVSHTRKAQDISLERINPDEDNLTLEFWWSSWTATTQKSAYMNAFQFQRHACCIMPSSSHRAPELAIWAVRFLCKCMPWRAVGRGVCRGGGGGITHMDGLVLARCALDLW